MRSKGTSRWIPALLAALAVSVFAGSTQAGAQTETILHAFAGTDGISPVLSLIFDSSGNLYGVTSLGGSSNYGSVFELTPKGGSWTEKTLYSFPGGTSGAQPDGGLVFDSAGNLYGSTKLGGTNGTGTVYELSKSSSGTWTEKVLHNFGGSKDGQYPIASLIIDSNGNLYGTTESGGAYGNGQQNSGGTSFELSPQTGGTWKETVLHSFGSGKDGLIPRSSLVRDKDGNLYGTTTLGGANGEGSVFELSAQSGGGWKESILYSFNPSNSSDGFLPVAGLTIDSSGNLYGTTEWGGPVNGGGTVFELSRQTNGTWQETQLYSFNWLSGDRTPFSGVIFDSAGNLYGANIGRADYKAYGTVFKLTPQTGTSWIETELYNFDNTHGAIPGIGFLTIDKSGNLYGATQAGGANDDGIVFEIKP
jgi:uncharacterized repeat protein (TIGR03803 family)